MSEAWENALLWGDLGFLMIFCIELVVRVAAYTPKMYFSDSWNIVDAGVVVVSLMATPFKSKITRGCRVLRMIRLLKNIEMFKMITTVMIASVKQIWYVLLVLALIMFTWAVFGIERFGDVKHGFAIDKHTNFADFSNAIYTLTQVMFGSWIYVRKDCRVKWPDCTPGSDCGSWMATPYFLSYLLINSFIMINMCVAVVLGNFAWIYATEKSGMTKSEDGSEMKKIISAQHIRIARKIWDEFDRRGTGYIIESDLCDFMVRCAPPLGLQPCRSEECRAKHGETACGHKPKCSAVPPLQILKLKQQVARFPFSRKGFCRFQDVVTARLVGHMGREVMSTEHVLSKTNEPVLRFQAAIRLVIDQLRIKKHQSRAVTRVHSSITQEDLQSTQESKAPPPQTPGDPATILVAKSDSTLFNLSQTLNAATDSSQPTNN